MVEVAFITRKEIAVGNSFKAVRFVAGITTLVKAAQLGSPTSPLELRRITLGKMGVLGLNAGSFEGSRHQIKQLDRFLYHMAGLAAGVRTISGTGTCDYILTGTGPLDQTIVPGIVAMVRGKGHRGAAR